MLNVYFVFNVPSNCTLIAVLGFGHLLALSLAEQGVLVFAGCLNERSDGAVTLNNKGSDRLHAVQCDVTDMASITRAKIYVEAHLGKRGTSQ